MDRRELLGMMGVGAAGLLATAAKAPAAAVHEHDDHLKTLGECAKLCNEAAHHCLGELKKESSGHREHHARAHELTMDCQAFCVLTATLMARSSPLAQYAHQACAEACRCCAEECEKGHDEIMKECAKKCRDCEQMCRSMSKAGSQEGK
jgi:hypothetical protein